MQRMCDGNRVVTGNHIQESEDAVGGRGGLASATDRHWASRWGALTQLDLRAGKRALVRIADDALD